MTASALREGDDVAADTDAFEHPHQWSETLEERSSAVAEDDEEIGVTSGMPFVAGERSEEPDLEDIVAPLEQVASALP